LLDVSDEVNKAAVVLELPVVKLFVNILHKLV